MKIRKLTMDDLESLAALYTQVANRFAMLPTNKKKGLR